MSKNGKETEQPIVSGVSSSAHFNGTAHLEQPARAAQANDVKRVVLFAGDNGTTHAVLNKLVPELLDAGIEPMIYLTPGSSSPKSRIDEIQDFSFFETGILEPVYDYLEHSHPITQENGEPREDKFYSPNQLAEFYGIHIEKIQSVNDPSLIEEINNDPTIIGSVSVKNYQLFSEPAIEALKQDDKFLWNVHTGELPKYRGVFVPVRVMQDDAKEYGWTLHEVDEGIDTGAVIDIRTRAIKPEMSALDAYYGMVEKGSGMIADNIKLAAKGMPRPPIPQNHDEARYFSFPTAEEIHELEERDPPRILYDQDAMIERYIQMFSDDSYHYAHSSGLGMVIQGAIEDYRNGVPLSTRAHLYVTDPEDLDGTAPPSA